MSDCTTGINHGFQDKGSAKISLRLFKSNKIQMINFRVRSDKSINLRFSYGSFTSLYLVSINLKRTGILSYSLIFAQAILLLRICKRMGMFTLFKGNPLCILSCCKSTLLILFMHTMFCVRKWKGPFLLQDIRHRVSLLHIFSKSQILNSLSHFHTDRFIQGLHY